MLLFLRCMIAISVGSLCGVTDCRAVEDGRWPQFRGPDGVANAEHQSIPLKFGPEQKQLWVTETPLGNSSPVIWDNKLFITGADNASLFVLCYDCTSGKQIWKRTYQSKFSEDYFHEDCTPAAPTSCTDGTRIVSCFGTYGLVAHDMNGKELWQRAFDDRAMNFGTASSPILDEGRVYYFRDTPLKSELLCLDAKTGIELWTVRRDAAQPSFSTPYVWRQGETRQIVVAGSGHLDAYDAESGHQIWTVTGLPTFVCPSPVATEDVLIFGAWTTGHVQGAERVRSGFSEGEVELTEEEQSDPAAFLKRFDKNKNGSISVAEFPPSRYKKVFRFFDKNDDGELELKEYQGFFKGRAATGRNVMVAIKPGGHGDITETHVLWETTKHLPYVASPQIHDGRVFCVRQGGLLTSWNLETGKMNRPKRLGFGGEYYATPIIVGDHLLVAAERGRILMISPQEKPKIVAENDLGENIFATPAIVNDRLYVRTKHHLYAFGNQD